MTLENLTKSAQKIFDALNADKLVIAANVPLDSIRIKNGRLIGFFVTEKRGYSIDLTNEEVAIYKKLETLHTPDAAPETAVDAIEATAAATATK